jgi:nickel-dependent lactate racemase
MVVTNPFGSKYADLNLPDHTQVVGMIEPKRVENPKKAIKFALDNPINSDSLRTIARKKMETTKKELDRSATAVVVVSDNTRPVPYKGDEGILLPVVELLVEEGYKVEDILILIATGTHRAMEEDEIADMIDKRVIDQGYKIINHDCTDDSNLTFLGKTSQGTDIFLNSMYVDADLKIATGLVESHFMAGASGGRKAVCPGLIGEKGTYIFHGAPFMAHQNSRDLNLEGNLVHEEAVEVATIAGIDFLVNVTLDESFKLTGVFTGDFIKAHIEAVEHISKSVKVPAKKADIVVTHAGFVGINHYQVAKCAVASLGILKENGHLVIIANTTDKGNVVGSINYRTTLAILKLVGPENFLKVINSDDWTFIPEQWQVQMWAKVFDRIPMENMTFFSPQMDKIWWDGLPGQDGSKYLDGVAKDDPNAFNTVVNNALVSIAKQEGKKLEELNISWISDGPYVIPEATN